MDAIKNCINYGIVLFCIKYFDYHGRDSYYLFSSKCVADSGAARIQVTMVRYFVLVCCLLFILAQPAWQDYEGRGKGKGYAAYKRFQRETREIRDVSTQARKKGNMGP